MTALRIPKCVENVPTSIISMRDTATNVHLAAKDVHLPMTVFSVNLALYQFQVPAKSVIHHVCSARPTIQLSVRHARKG